jgi:hypothetical protein
MSHHVSQPVLKIFQLPKLLGMYVSNRAQKADASQGCLNVSLQNSRNYGFPGRLKGQSQPPPKLTVSQTCPKQTSQGVSNNDVQSDTVSPCGPRGSNSNVVQRSPNNDGSACTNRAFNNTARASIIVGSYTGKWCGGRKHPSLGSVEGEGLHGHSTGTMGVSPQYNGIIIHTQ